MAAGAALVNEQAGGRVRADGRVVSRMTPGRLASAPFAGVLRATCTIDETARRLGTSRGFVVRATATGRCQECGDQAAGDCCRACEGKSRRKWDRDSVVAAIRAFHAEHGRLPAAWEWNATIARERSVDAYERWRASRGAWPGAATVQREFGSWNAAIAAAGFEPRAYGGKAPANWSL